MKSTSSLLGLIAASLFQPTMQPRSGIMHRTRRVAPITSRHRRNYELARHPANRNLGAVGLSHLR